MQLLVLLTYLFAQTKDPNDYNPCGQFNSYMPNLCDYDRNSETSSEKSRIQVCHDCYLPQVYLFDNTSFKTSNDPVDGSNQNGRAEGVD